MTGNIAFSGLASGLDTELLISSLLASKQKRVTNVEDALKDLTAQRNAFSDLKRVLGVLNTTAADLGTVILGNKSAESSDTKYFTATADSGAELGSHDIEISNLAQKSVATIGKAVGSTSDVIGAGTLTLNLDGAPSISVTLSDGNSTILDLRDAINTQYKEEFAASVIETTPGSFQLLVSTKESGANFNIKDEADGASSSSITGFGSNFLDATQPNSGGITTTQTGEDANFTVDGIAITRTSNEITDVIEGVTLNLKAETTGIQTLTVSSNQDEVIKGLEEFVGAYNDAQKMISDLSGSEGALAGDSSLRGLRNQIQSLISTSVSNIGPLNLRDDGTVGYSALSQIGFSTDRQTGELSLDTEKLKTALDEHFTEVENLFKGGFTTTNSNVTLEANTGTGFSGSVLLDTVNDTATIGGQVFNLVRSGNVLSFAEGSTYEGMIFEANASVSSVTVEISQGLGSRLEEMTDEYVSFSGILNNRTTSLDEQERRLNDQMDYFQAIVDNERTRLTAVFAKAEQSLSQLQALQSSLNSLGS